MKFLIHGFFWLFLVAGMMSFVAETQWKEPTVQASVMPVPSPKPEFSQPTVPLKAAKKSFKKGNVSLAGKSHDEIKSATDVELTSRFKNEDWTVDDAVVHYKYYLSKEGHWLSYMRGMAGESILSIDGEAFFIHEKKPSMITTERSLLISTLISQFRKENQVSSVNIYFSDKASSKQKKALKRYIKTFYGYDVHVLRARNGLGNLAIQFMGNERIQK